MREVITLKVRITGFFGGPQTARDAGRSLGNPENGATGLIVTTDCLPMSGAFGAVGALPDGGNSFTVTVLCDNSAERFVVSELTRLGAAKINVSR